MIFRLSPILGGRSEVLDSTVMEALMYLELHKEDQEEERYDNYIMHLHASPMIESKYREQYMKTIEPKRHRQESIKLETDKSQLQRLKQKQEKERQEELKGE